MSNQSKVTEVKYDGFSSTIKKYEGKTKDLYIKTEQNSAGNMLDNMKYAIAEYIGFAVLKEMQKHTKGIRIPSTIKISYEINKKAIENLKKLSLEDLNLIEERFLKSKLIDYFFKGRGLALQILTSGEKAGFVGIANVDDPLSKINMFANFFVPMIIIGNQDTHGENILMKSTGKSHYAIDLGLAFDYVSSSPLEFMFSLLIEPKKNIKYAIGRKDDIKKISSLEQLETQFPGLYFAAIKRIKKKMEQLIDIDYNSIIDENFNKVIDMINKACDEYRKNLQDVLSKSNHYDSLLEEFDYSRKHSIEDLNRLNISMKKAVAYNKNILNRIEALRDDE